MIAWRPVLLAICALAALVQVAGVIDATGMGGAPPWLGWWGANSGASSQPFVHAPDESDALLALAHGVGTAFDVLSVQREPSNNLVLRELAELREDVKRMARARSDAAS